MNKLIKYIGGIGIIAGAAYLLHTHSTTLGIKRTRASFTKSRQLLNRLIQQLKVTKYNAVNLKTALQKMDLRPIQRHFNKFNNQFKPEFKKIQDISQKMKK